MTPFNLELAKKGLPMKTRDRTQAKFICLLQGGQPAPLIVELMKKPAGKGGIYLSGTCTENYYIDGRHGTVHDSPLDLFMDENGY